MGDYDGDFITFHNQVMLLLSEYHKWLCLLAKYGGAHILSPSDKIDMVWHTHILDTEDYMDTCEKICGKIIHHYPQNAFESQEKERISRHNNTITFYKEKYGLMSEEVEEIWKLLEPSGMFFVRSLNGNTRSLPYSKDMKVLNVKQMIQEKEGPPVCEQRLIYAGKSLSDNVTLGSYDIQEESTLHLVLRVGGC